MALEFDQHRKWRQVQPSIRLSLSAADSCTSYDSDPFNSSTRRPVDSSSSGAALLHTHVHTEDAVNHRSQGPGRRVADSKWMMEHYGCFVSELKGVRPRKMDELIPTDGPLHNEMDLCLSSTVGARPTIHFASLFYEFR